MTPNELSHELERIYGDNLKSVVLYGSAAGGEHSKDYSDYNLFCVLDSTAPAELAKANRILKKWTKRGNPPPHFFDANHIETSLDVFPLEFLDMMDRHIVIIGRDPLEGIDIDPKNLRHQCESELKGKLIHLRAYYAANCHKPKRIAEIVVRSFSTYLSAFRGILRLIGEKPPMDGKIAVELLCEHIDINPQVFFDVIAIRRGESILPRGDEVMVMFERYLTEITTVTNYVDGMQC